MSIFAIILRIRRAYKWYVIGRLCSQLVRQFFVVGYQMSDVNVAVVLPAEHVLSNLIAT